jgi:hypothetical protein
LPIARAPQPSTATAHDYRCGCIVQWRDRGEAPRRRARWPAQCGAGDGETYIHRDGRECGWAGSVLLLRIRLRGAWGSFGVECTAAVHRAMCLHATEGGGWQCHDQRCDSARRRRARRKAAVGMPEWGDVWVTSDAPGETSMGGSRAAGRGLSAPSWKRWRCLRARLQLPQRRNVSSPVRMRAGRRRSGSGRITRMGLHPRHLGAAWSEI